MQVLIPYQEKFLSLLHFPLTLIVNSQPSKFDVEAAGNFDTDINIFAE